jgi:hypothetical protein
MRFLFFIIFILFVFSACENNNKVPPGVIPENQFVSLLVDIHIADASISILQFKEPRYKLSPDDYYYSILKKHNTNKREFDKSLEYYSRDLERYNRIYDDVLRNLSILQGNLSKKEIVQKTK